MERLEVEKASLGKATVNNLVEWFLSKENMSHKKIQKLCYYAEAWSVTLNNEDIVPGIEFEAWQHGPVCREIWEMCKKFGWRDIMIKEEFADISKEEIDKRFSEDQKAILELVWNTYGKYSPNELEAITHTEDPWIKARSGLGPFDSCTNVINVEDMKEYYSTQYEA